MNAQLGAISDLSSSNFSPIRTEICPIISQTNPPRPNSKIVWTVRFCWESSAVWQAAGMYHSELLQEKVFLRRGKVEEKRTVQCWESITHDGLNSKSTSVPFSPLSLAVILQWERERGTELTWSDVSASTSFTAPQQGCSIAQKIADDLKKNKQNKKKCEQTKMKQKKTKQKKWEQKTERNTQQGPRTNGFLRSMHRGKQKKYLPKISLTESIKSAMYFHGALSNAESL